MTQVAIEIAVWLVFVAVTIFVAACVKAFFEAADSCGAESSEETP